MAQNIAEIAERIKRNYALMPDPPARTLLNYRPQERKRHMISCVKN
jgi:hypothetical protein